MGVLTVLKKILLIFLLILPTFLHALTVQEIRELRAKHQLSSLLVLGDSSVDPGNNNYLITTFKSNFRPYGIDFIDGRPTGRFSDGRLGPDFIAEALGYAKVVPPFLDANLTKVDLLHAVSFASSGSGYDELTANLTNSLSLGRQVDYLRHYKIHIRQLVGYKMTGKIIARALLVLSMGTNDYIQNYFLEAERPRQFTLDKYQDFLVSCMRRAIKDMHMLGAKRIAVVGVPPVGCMPIVISIAGDGTNCVEKYNKAVLSLNYKIQRELEAIRKELKMKTWFVDSYKIIKRAIDNPIKYGFTETSKGCCGSGTFEIADSCKGSNTCKDPRKYIFWDAVHPSERIYKIVADEALKSFTLDFMI